MDLLDATIVQVALPSIGADLAASEAQLEWIVSGYLLAFVGAAWLAGRAAERWKGGRLLAAIFGVDLLLLAAGTLWLSAWMGHGAWMEGFVPFVPGALAQTLAAWVATQAFRRSKA